ncbi:hypothetical protein [Buttiauxella sp. A111]|uniref:hypothetical protein n=1 Tax=Buttiauxella sp. A111 TaxID=2563088 RepID=UPI0010D9ECC7|nr:hypothetical protein [Buttiauxella sp. A111]GDX06327.1 hypothetical protein BSPA111_25360 [Buttiauxella sp. A111]
MFKNLFNRKAIALEELVDELRSQLNQSSKERAALRIELHNKEGFIAGQNAQIIQLRGIASGLRDRIQTHGKTEAEHRFIASCLDIFKNGRGLSRPRFHAAMKIIEKERESMTDWNQEAQRLDVSTAAQVAVENAVNVRTETF